MNTPIEIHIYFDGEGYHIPVNPEELTISQKASNQNIDTIGLGKITRKGEPELRTVKIKSFFPSPTSRYFTGTFAVDYIRFIEKIWRTENTNNKVALIQSLGIEHQLGRVADIVGEDLNMYFVIENFEYTYNGGDFDTAYTLSIKEYKPYGVKRIEPQFTGMATARTTSTSAMSTPGMNNDQQPTTEKRTYVVKSGDNLWSITQRSVGNGARWGELYELNKDIIGGNPKLIYAGQVLTLPEGWNVPADVARSKNSTTKSSNRKLANSTSSQSINKDTGTSLTPKQLELYAYKEELERYKQDILATQKWITKHDLTIAQQAKLGFTIGSSEVYSMQSRYNLALEKSNDPNLTEEQRQQAVRELRKADLKEYNRTKQELKDLEATIDKKFHGSGGGTKF